MTILHRTKLLFIFSLICVFLTACNTGYGRSGNRDLASLTVSVGTLTPSFDKDTTSYEVVIGVQDITFTAVTASDKASMKLDGSSLTNDVPSAAQSLDIDEERTFVIEVTAENELEKSYRITVTREPPSSDASLSSLEVEGGELDPVFSSTTTDYDVTSSYFVNATRVTVVRGNNQAAVTSSDLPDESLSDDDPSEELSLNVGSTTIELNVTAGDQTTTENYTVDITRAPQADLANSVYFKAEFSDEADTFGNAIAFDSGVLVVGAPFEDSNSVGSPNSNLAENSGAVYLFEYNTTETQWEQTQFVKSSSITEGESFGSSVAIDGNIMVVGAPGNNSNAGRIYILDRSDEDDDWSHDELEAPSELNSGDQFGSVVDIYGDYIAVGAPATSSDAGAVYIFERSGSSWTQMQSIFDTNGNGRFGEALAFNRQSEDPELIVGSPNEDAAAGAVRIYELDDDVWVRDEEDGTLTLAVSNSGDRFGASIAINNNRLVIGAPGEASDANGVDGDEDDTSLPNSGAAYVFERTSQGTDWEQEHYFKATQDSNMLFGSSVAMSANMIAVGAPLEDSNATGIDNDDDNTSAENSGAVYVFEQSGDTWLSQVYVKASNTGAFDRFGSGLAFLGSNLFVAAENEDGGGNGMDPEDNNSAADAGAVYLID